MGALEDAIAAGNFSQAGELSSLFSQPTIGAGDFGISQGQPFVADPAKRQALAMILARGGQQQQAEQAAQQQQLQFLKALSGLPDEIVAPLLGKRFGIKPGKSKQERAAGLSLQSALMQSLFRHQLGAPEREARAGERKESLELRRTGQEQAEEARQESLGLRREAGERQDVAMLNNLKTAIEFANFSSDPQIREAAPALSRLFLQELLRVSKTREGRPAGTASKGKTTVRRIE